MAAIPYDRTIVVSHHAATRMRERLAERAPLRVLIERIEELVRCGFETGQVIDHKPKNFLLYGRTKDALPRGQRFVWCGDEPQFGFIVERKPDGTDVVMTTLTRTRS